MRGAALLGLMLLSGGCQTVEGSLRGPHNRPLPGVGVLVQGMAGRCAPVVVGNTVRRVCLPPPDTGKAAPDTAKADSLAVTR